MSDIIAPTMDTQNSENSVIETSENFVFETLKLLPSRLIAVPSTTAESVKEYNYKIRDDSVRPREFLRTDNEDGIEAILMDRKGHSLHKFINGDDQFVLLLILIYPEKDLIK